MEEVAGKGRKKENKEKKMKGMCVDEKKREKKEENMDKKIK